MMTLSVDGIGLLSNAGIGSTMWASYTASANLASGTHTLSISGVNLGAVKKGKTC